MKLTLPIAGFVFLLGMYVDYMNYGESYLENFENKDCPNLLIQKGSKIIFENIQKEAEIPGVNPIEFNNLEEYVEFTEVACDIKRYTMSRFIVKRENTTPKIRKYIKCHPDAYPKYNAWYSICSS